MRHAVRVAVALILGLACSSSTQTAVAKGGKEIICGIAKYPNRPGPTRGPALTDIENARPETKALSVPPVDLQKLPININDVLKQPLP